MSLNNRIIDGRYEIKAIIGQGGMADVYLAEDLILKREVAVKILRETLAEDPIYVKRFQREASAAATLTNKNIVEIYDVGQENNHYYIVMEFVSGQTLKDLIFKRGALHMAEAIDIMKQVTSGVDEAHRCGIIHRDLKPQNILVTDSGIAKIADFGIASIESVTNVTKADTIMGSLHYLAPEIARGQKATPQSDIYSLGIMFYELLVGQVPFNGESPVNIALKHMREDIPSVCEMNPTIYQSVENIIIKATAKNVENRYTSAKEMYDDLCVALDHPHDRKLEFQLKDEDTTIVADNETLFHDELEQEDEVEVKEKPKKKKNKKISKTKSAIIGAVIVFVIVGIILITHLLGSSGKQVKVPNVVGKSVDEATTLLKNAGFEVNEDSITYEASDEYEKDQVISTSPNASSLAKEKSEVKLTVSKGQYIVIENYIGQNIDKIQVQLEKLGFTVETKEEDSDQEDGTILYQSISEGKKIAPDATNKTITFKVALKYVVLDNYVGQDVESAKASLEALGFKVTTKEENSQESSGKVLKQSKDAGTKYTQNSNDKSITLTYSIGVAKATVNNYLGIEINAAKQSLENAGFNVTLEVLPTPSDEDEIRSMKINVVIDQSLSPGEYEKGQKITLYYYKEKPTVSSSVSE